MTITAHDLRQMADALDAAAATQQEIAFLKSEVARLRAERNQWKEKAWRAHYEFAHAAKYAIPKEIKKKLISCVHPDHCSSVHANSVSQWLLAQ